MDHDGWPALRLDRWEPTYLTLHRWTQVVGKVALARAPHMNHWWHVALHVTPEGLVTGPLVDGARTFDLTLDLSGHRLIARASDGRVDGFDLVPMTVATFEGRVLDVLAALGIDVAIWSVPCEVLDTTPFEEDFQHASYDRSRVEDLHRILVSVDAVFRRHRGRFVGKASPVHFFWGAFDLAVSRYSGRPNPSPPVPEMMRRAYSHEVISHGFWPGGDWPGHERVTEPVFYAYSVPEPRGFSEAPVLPRGAYYSPGLAEFILPYEQVRTSEDPTGMLLDFMESTYLAAAERAGWDVDALRDVSCRDIASPPTRAPRAA